MALIVVPAVAGEVYVAPDGNDADTGTPARPLRTLTAARDAVRRIRGDGGATVILKGGRYALRSPLELGERDSGTKEAPMVYRAAEGATVVLDGGVRIDTSLFRKVTGAAALGRLHPRARGRVWAADLNALKQKGQFAGGLLGPQISLDGQMFRLARWPNRGYAHIGKVHRAGAVYAHGRTKGEPPAYSTARPIGAVFSPREPLSKQVAAEFARTGDLFVQGFLAYDWYKTTDPVARVEEDRIQLLRYYRYPVGRTYEKIPRRFRLLGLLCELDSPGEWYFDRKEGLFYVWPPRPLNAGSILSVWHTPTLIHLKNASHVVVRDLAIESARREPVVIEGGHDNLLAGCTIRNSGRGVTIRGGRHNGIVACDIFDVGGHHIILDGGTANASRIVPAGHYAINNHLTQIAHDGERGVRIRGVGNVFRRNLVHDFLGQAVVYGGNDHRIELNEIYNVGIEEGDGGAIYCGAQLWSYGNVVRHNFIHHLMCVPQAHPRGGVYLDDLDAGDTVEGNILYKAAHRAVLVNGGAANVVRGNLFIRGYIGAYVTSAYADKARGLARQYDSGTLRRGDKMDYVWRCEQVVGRQGWNRPPWSSRYPRFRQVMNEDPYWPTACRFEGNLFCGNVERFQYRTGWGEKGVGDIHKARGIQVAGNVDVALDAFRSPERLDFRFRRNRRPPEGFKAIPFEAIGLFRDSHRTRLPDKKAYRAAVRKRFETRSCYDPKAVYDPERINDLLYGASPAGQGEAR